MAHFVENKPPLGVMPESIWVSLRIKELILALARYHEHKMDIPVEWLIELRKHLNNTAL